MRTSCKLVLVVWMAMGMAAQAADLVIESFDSSGQVTFGEVANAAGYRVDWSSNIVASAWSSNAPGIGAVPAAGSGSRTVTVGVEQAWSFYRVVASVTSAPPPIGMVLIPAGSFVMGNATNVFPADEGYYFELPQHQVYVSAFYMGRYEVTKAQWDEVYTWAITNGYGFDYAGSGKATNHPVQTINWYDMVKWCNARSQKEGRTAAYYTSAAQTTIYKTGWTNVANDWVKWTEGGCRLPTEAEWEKAARGGVANTRFPWADVNIIDHSRANYYSYWSGGAPYYAYDLGYAGYDTNYTAGGTPYMSPVGAFAPNGYGLYDMAGNVWEWCWDWWGDSYYATSPGTDPRGPATGSSRVTRGGCWDSPASDCRVAGRSEYNPNYAYRNIGFRVVLPAGQ